MARGFGASLSISHIRGVVMHVSLWVLFLWGLMFFCFKWNIYGLICISIYFFTACVYALSQTAPWQNPWKLSETLLTAAGIEAAATGKRNRQNTPVSVCESVCHKDLLPTPSMTALFRRSHPHCAEDRQGQQPERTVPQVEPATPHKNAKASVRKLTSLQTFSGVTRWI